MKDNQHEQLFTELTPEAASVVGGGATIGVDLNFDSFVTTKSSFTVSKGSKITLLTYTKNTGEKNPNSLFKATLRNLNTGATSLKNVKVGEGTATWTSGKGGTYKIDFTDTPDGTFVTGNGTISYS